MNNECPWRNMLQFVSSKTKIQHKAKVMCPFCTVSMSIFFPSCNRRKGDVKCQELFIRLAHVLPINTLSSLLSAVDTLWINICSSTASWLHGTLGKQGWMIFKTIILSRFTDTKRLSLKFSQWPWTSNKFKVVLSARGGLKSKERLKANNKIGFWHVGWEASRKELKCWLGDVR